MLMGSVKLIKCTTKSVCITVLKCQNALSKYWTQAMAVSLCYALLFSFSSNVTAQQTFMNTYDFPTDFTAPIAFSVQETAQHDHVFYFGQGLEIGIGGLDSLGNLRGAVRIDESLASGTNIIKTQDGNFAMFLFTWGSAPGSFFPQDPLFVKFDEFGQILTSNVITVNMPLPFGTTTTSISNRNSLIQTSDGGYLACMTISDTVGYAIESAVTPTGSLVSLPVHWRMIRLDSNGNLLWSQVVHSPFPEERMDSFSSNLVELPNQDFLVSGAYVDGTGQTVGCISRIDATGTILWTRSYQPLSGSVNAIVSSVSLDPNNANEYYVLAYELGVAHHLIKIDGSGNELWSVSYQIPANYLLGEIRDLKVVSDGLIMSGTALSFVPFEGTQIIMKTDFNGNIIWSNKYEANGQIQPAFTGPSVTDNDGLLFAINKGPDCKIARVNALGVTVNGCSANIDPVTIASFASNTNNTPVSFQAISAGVQIAFPLTTIPICDMEQCNVETPQLSYSVSQTVLPCLGDSSQITGSVVFPSISPIVDYAWSPSSEVSNANGDSSQVTVIPSALGPNEYIVGAEDYFGCVHEDTFSITVTSACLLPIELSEFRTDCINGKQRISWTTQSETNNNYFILESSSNGQNFREVAQLDGAGNSYSQKSYSYVNEHAHSEMYYRLIQVDVDGTQNVSHTISSEQCFASASDVLNCSIVDLTLEVSFRSDKPESCLIQMVDTRGNIIGQGAFTTGIGVSSHQLNLQSSLSNGVYFVYVYKDSGALTRKVIWYE